MINSSENCENCYYGKLLQTCRDVMDSSYAYDSELLYECFNVKKCYNCIYLSYSQNCFDCHFSENLKGCNNCFLSTNLSNKEFYFMDQPMAKDEYQKRVKEFLGSHAKRLEAKEKLAELRKKRIHKYSNIVNSENSTGDFLLNCKNCTDCFDVNDSQDCKYLVVGVDTKDLMDCSNMYLKPELCYQVLGTIAVYNCIFSLYVFHTQNAMYSQFCYNSSNLFGCFGLRNKKYCILNKQYSQEEYEQIVPKIIDHMKNMDEFGKYFPARLSPFGYNETVAHEYFPLARAEATAKGFHWQEKDVREYQPQSYAFPDDIGDVKDDVLNMMFACETCGKNYKIIPQELRRLRAIPMPIPRKCPDCRHFERMSLRNPRKLWPRHCGKCKKPVQSTFAKEMPAAPLSGGLRSGGETIYCEDCYLKEVY